MALGLDTITFDCADPVKVAEFWAAAMGFEVVERAPEGAFVADPSGESKGFFFQKVPEPKVAKNRVHLDLRPTRSMAEEVERLLGLGATVQGRIDVEGGFWTIMLDPEGNELCVLRGPEDGWSPDEL